MIILPAAMFLIIFVLSKLIGVGSFGNELSLKTALRTGAFQTLVAIGMSFNLLSNRWDYSVGASLTLASIIAPNLAKTFGLSAFPTLILSMAVCTVFTTIVGLAYIIVRIHPLVTSMGFLLVYEGISNIFNNGMGANVIGKSYMDLNKFPYFLIVFGVLFIFAIILFGKTQYGYHLRQVSYGSEVAVNMGIKEPKIVLLAYVLSGVFIGAAAYMNATMKGSIWPANNSSSVAVAFACCVPFFVGKFLSKYGNMMIGIAMGGLTIGFMNTGLASLGASASVQTIINGLFLLGVLLVSANQTRVTEFFDNRRTARAARKKISEEA